MPETNLLNLLRELDRPVRRSELMRLSGLYAEDLLAALDVLEDRGDVVQTSKGYCAITQPAGPVQPPYRPDWRGSEWKPDTHNHWSLTEAARKIGIR